MTKVSVPLAQPSNVSLPKEGQLVGALLKEKSWLEHASQLLEKGEIEKGDTVAWSAFHDSLLDAPAALHTTYTAFAPFL